MAFFETPLNDEINFISRKVFQDNIYMDVLYESVHTPNWFKAIWEIMKSKGGWKCLSKNYKEKTMLMSKRTLLLCAETVLDKLEASFDFSNKEDCEYLVIYFNIMI